MSTYLPMWEKIKELNEEDTDKWIDEIAPATGREIDFFDMKIIDVDLLEALRHWKKDVVWYGKAVLNALPGYPDHRKTVELENPSEFGHMEIGF